MPATSDNDLALYAVALSLLKADVGISVERAARAFYASTGQMPTTLTIRITSRSSSDCIAEVHVPDAIIGSSANVNRAILSAQHGMEIRGRGRTRV